MPSANTTMSDLDLFMLALVQSGLGTPYDLKAQAGLSVGSTAPVLARLEQAGLIVAGSAGVRNSRRFRLTNAGRKLVKSSWQAAAKVETADIDQALRIAFLAWAFGKRESIATVIERASSAMKGLADVRRAEANQLRPSTEAEVSGSAFRWLRAKCEAARLTAQSEALIKLLREIQSINKKSKKNQ